MSTRQSESAWLADPIGVTARRERQRHPSTCVLKTVDSGLTRCSWSRQTWRCAVGNSWNYSNIGPRATV